MRRIGFIGCLALAGLVAGVVYRQRKRQTQALHDSESVQRWEDEGGPPAPKPL